MKCTNCSADIPEHAGYCSSCGMPSGPPINGSVVPGFDTQETVAFGSVTKEIPRVGSSTPSPRDITSSTRSGISRGILVISVALAIVVGVAAALVAGTLKQQRAIDDLRLPDAPISTPATTSTDPAPPAEQTATPPVDDVQADEVDPEMTDEPLLQGEYTAEAAQSLKSFLQAVVDVDRDRAKTYMTDDFLDNNPDFFETHESLTSFSIEGGTEDTMSGVWRFQVRELPDDDVATYELVEVGGAFQVVQLSYE